MRQVPENILRNPLFKTDILKVYEKAFTDTNTQLHKQQIDDTMSGARIARLAPVLVATSWFALGQVSSRLRSAGTTAITVQVRGKKAYVANVGDSRAVLGVKVGQRIVAQDLSSDQTPFRCVAPTAACRTHILLALCCCWPDTSALVRHLFQHLPVVQDQRLRRRQPEHSPPFCC